MSSFCLYYIHDPMCSWCWGFRPVWGAIREAVENNKLNTFSENIDLRYVLGGLAPDSDEPMPQQMRQYIQSAWQQIQAHIHGTEFNFDYWVKCQPRRSTYPSCRAVLAAKKQGQHYEAVMIDGIQRAYYLEVKNPSDVETLCQVAESIGLDMDSFSQDLNSEETEKRLQEELNLCQKLFYHSGASGFPSLVLQLNDHFYAVPRDYNNSKTALDFIEQKIQELA